MLLIMWDLPELGIEPMSPALAGGSFTTELSQKPWFGFLLTILVALAREWTLGSGGSWEAREMVWQSLG